MRKWGVDGWRRVQLGCAGLMTFALIGGCDERERLIFPPPNDGIGPATFIDAPTSDTTVRAGPDLVVVGRTIDPDGVDSVYFFVLRGSDSFQPAKGQRDTLRFSLPVTTSGHLGDTLDVVIYGVDRLGNQGQSAVRRILVR